MTMALSLSPHGTSASIHRIIGAFQRALTALEVQVKPLDLERCSVLVHEAMGGRGRLFHRAEHIFDIAAGTRDPLETLAILFHDVVYVQVDGALPPAVVPLIAQAMRLEAGAYRVAAVDKAEDPVAHLVFQVFGVSPGQTLSPASGLSELLSALVAARLLAPMLPAGSWVQVVACIEATIAFRDRDVSERSPFDRLADRLAALSESPLGRPGSGSTNEIVETVQRAVRVANGDVGNFADPDPAAFLDETWKLLPESNPALYTPTSTTIRQYRAALCKMEAFLGALTPARVFHQWRSVPDDATYQALLDSAQRNLDMAGRYLRAKLYATGLLEAIASCTGGDAPLELFTGALPVRDAGQALRTIEDFLPTIAAADPTPIDPELLHLLADGRATETTFDLRASPISAFLIQALGEARVREGVGAAQAFFEGGISALSFLRSQRSPALDALIAATLEMATTRTDLLRSLPGELERAPLSAPGA
jgi:hypothetical protein